MESNENINFFREKNALSIQNATTIKPTKEELKVELVKKIEQKVNQIEIIENKKKRDNYLMKKGLLEKTKNISENDIKSKLALRVCVDLFELIFDLIDIFELMNLKSFDLYIKQTNLTNIGIYEQLKTILSNYLIHENKEIPTKLMLELFVNYYQNFNFDIETIKSEQQKVIEKEGSFKNGLFVIR